MCASLLISAPARPPAYLRPCPVRLQSTPRRAQTPPLSATLHPASWATTESLGGPLAWWDARWLSSLGVCAGQGVAASQARGVDAAPDAGAAALRGQSWCGWAHAIRVACGRSGRQAGAEADVVAAADVYTSICRVWLSCGISCTGASVSIRFLLAKPGVWVGRAGARAMLLRLAVVMLAA